MIRISLQSILYPPYFTLLLFLDFNQAMQFFISQAKLCYSKFRNCFFHQKAFISNHLPRPRLINLHSLFLEVLKLFSHTSSSQARAMSLKLLTFTFTCRSQTFPRSSSSPAKVTSLKSLTSLVLPNHTTINLNFAQFFFIS